jgi:hypothetical protein
MANTGLPYGPFRLTDANVRAVAKSFPGAYALSREPHPSAFVVNYVGRSDDDLMGRLLCHVGEGRYSHFKCGHAANAEEAFNWECRMYHDFPGLDNSIHPDRPNGLAALLYMTCPRCQKFG